MHIELSGRKQGDFAAGDLGVRMWNHWRSSAPSESTHHGAFDEHVAEVREAVADSVARHLRADVPTCLLLSGGLDSSIIAACAASRRGTSSREPLRTYCSGARADAGPDLGDFPHARLMADQIGARHREAPVARDAFARRWREMVHTLGLPLSTPNEVAINTVAKALRADGQVVTLSGEGADELFAGYEEPLRQAWQFEHSRRRVGPARRGLPENGGLHQLHANAWIPLHVKEALFTAPVWRGLNADADLEAAYKAEFAAVSEGLSVDDHGFASEPLEPHLRFLRRINLAGLLARLDTATMLESVEARTPFADGVVADLAESLPMSDKLSPAALHTGSSAPAAAAAADLARELHPAADSAPSAGRSTVQLIAPPRSGTRSVAGSATRTAHDELPATKRVLRAAFAGVIPAPILHRPKASFPLPFEQWIVDQVSHLGVSGGEGSGGDGSWGGGSGNAGGGRGGSDAHRGGIVRDSAFARSIFSEAAIELVSADPAANWRLAWPMMNIALWARRWWG